ncbi:precorrin-6A reductase [Streptococcus danieliae]|uniref:Precorrin-6A reductase n=1 Tax=Streptococcus danieliae TaxID=747656 RepID=A0A7X3G708_9STRE|nr:precorrin-6A reductase [Streptococcus danieliae]MVX58097.1 precorrin-6A reductase [Streptococcus danieliae]
MTYLLLGGTSDSQSILALFASLNLPVITSVVTDYGRHLAFQYGQPVIQGRMTAEQMLALVKDRGIRGILDATHPFADLVSKEAIRAADLAQIPYLRFERPTTTDLSGAKVVHSTQEAIAWIREQGFTSVYLGTGSKTLDQFVAGLPNVRFQARVLPTSEVVAHCESLGLVADQIDALKAPFSKECNRELWKRAKAQVFVSKESGAVGGIREKIDTCLELGIACLIIARPLVNYPNQVSTLEELEDYLGAERM